MHSPKILLIVSSLILSGCVSLAPEYQRPNLNVPEQLVNNTHSSAKNNSQALVLPNWEAFIKDSQMQKLVQQALDKNNDLYLAALNIEEARAQYGITDADKYPQVMSSVSSEYSRGLNNDASLNKKYSAGIDISYELDFFGRIKNLSESEKAKFLASQEMYRATKILTVKTVSTAYLDIVYNQQLLLIAEETKTNYQNSQSIVMQKMIAGKANIADLEQANGQVQSIDITIEKIKNDIAKNNNLIELLTNDYANKLDVNSSDIIFNYPLISMPSNLPSEILLQRPDIMAAEHTIIAENANIGAARAAFFPSISFNGGLANSNDSLTGLFDSVNGMWSFLPKITLPIFTGKKNSQNLELANIRKNKAIVNYEKSIQVAFQEVRDALIVKSSVEKQIASQKNYVGTLESVLIQKQTSYGYGSASYLDVLESQRSLFTEKQNLLQLQIEQQKNEINLFTALGGGVID